MRPGPTARAISITLRNVSRDLRYWSRTRFPRDHFSRLELRPVRIESKWKDILIPTYHQRRQQTYRICLEGLPLFASFRVGGAALALAFPFRVEVAICRRGVLCTDHLRVIGGVSALAFALRWDGVCFYSLFEPIRVFPLGEGAR